MIDTQKSTSKLNYTDLSEYTLATIPVEGGGHATSAHFIAWQEGFEPSFIEVQFNKENPVDIDDAIDIACEHMKSLDRGQDDLPDFYCTRSI
jgi:hypothetical protein